MTEEYLDKEMREEVKSSLRQTTKKKPWDNYKAIRKGVTMEPEEYISMVEKIANFDLKMAAFFSLLYLTGCRLQELTRYKYDGKYADKRDQEQTRYKSAIQVGDIKLEFDKERKVYWLVITTRVEKKKGKKEVLRQSYIIADKNYSDGTFNYLYPLIEILESYLTQNFSDSDNTTPLFTFHPSHVYDNTQKYLKLTPHAIRGMRAKHLVRRHNFDITALKSYFSWTDSTIAAEYASSEEKDIKRRLMGEK
ncbi:MAG TPA: hypothetical protein VMZ91_11720 [Candidatus Paceibacterota bacterium]|nr:hypothetical protein [Candidatus Paceibacterota bacterium]